MRGIVVVRDDRVRLGGIGGEGMERVFGFEGPPSYLALGLKFLNPPL